MSEIATVKSPCLHGIAEAFKVNLERTMFFQMWPAEIAFQSRRDAIFQCNAVNLQSNRRHTNLVQFIEQEGGDLFFAEWNKQVAEVDCQPLGVQNYLRGSLGVNYIESLLSVNNGMLITMDSIFASIVTSSWTAFECLAADAWVQAVNHSSDLRKKVNASSQVKKRGEDSDGLENKLEIDPVADYGGSLIESKRVSFQTLRNIKAFYGVILDKKSKDRIFKDTANGYVSALSEVRNVLTHKAGIVDSQFTQRVSNFPELSAFKQGESLLLNGEIVKKLRAASAQTASAILATVDEIISPLPAS
jgi:hypothetical protein